MNQCMGCQAGWPLVPGTDAHETRYPNGGMELVGCTRDRYIARDGDPLAPRQMTAEQVQELVERVRARQDEQRRAATRARWLRSAPQSTPPHGDLVPDEQDPERRGTRSLLLDQCGP